MAEAPVTFLLKSVVRGKGNRTERWLQPGRVPFVQKFAGGTITVRRARPARITEAALLANIVEIRKAVAAHQIIVVAPTGEVLDLESLLLAPAAPSKPLPNPPLDSAKNDKNLNVGYDVPPTPEGTTMGAPEPELLKLSALQEPEPVLEPAAELPSEGLPALLSPEVPEESAAAEAEPQAETTPAASPQSEPQASKKHKGKGRRG